MPVEIFRPENHIQPPLQSCYELHLDSKFRWRESSPPTINGFRESLLIHIKGMRAIEAEIINSNSYTNLASAVNMWEVGAMTYVHDAGELGSWGDLSRSNPRYQELAGRQRFREAKFFIRIMNVLARKGAIDPETQQQAIDLYLRATRKDPLDKEAQLTEYIDKVQGARTALEHVYNYKEAGLTQPTDEMRQASKRTISMVLMPVSNLLIALERDEKAKSEMVALAREELDSFSQAGYEHQVNEVVEQFGLRDILSSKLESAIKV